MTLVDKIWEIEMSKTKDIKMYRNDRYDFDVQNVRNRNVQKRQINHFGAQNVGNRNG